VSEDSSFASLISLACHDLRTPLATVQGFARTIPRVAELPEQPARHLRMIDEAATEMAVHVDPEAVERSLASLARAALRHGGLTEVRMEVRGTEISIGPTTPESVPVLAGEELRDLGTEVARRVVEAIGGSLSLKGDRLLIRLP
jgi:signal transduction histidine kinase